MAAAAIAAHATVLGGGFIWLDHAHIGARLAVRPPDEWLELFRQPFAGTGYYRPLTALSLSIDGLAGTAWLFHTTNLLLHAAAAVLLVLAGEALGASRRAATLGALLFAAHPIGSLVAGAIAFRSEALVACGLFGLIAAHQRGRIGWAVVALLVAGLSKETGLALAPLYVVALELGRREARGRRWSLLAAEGGAFAVALGLRLAFAPTWRGTFPVLTGSEAIGTRLAAFARSVTALLFPVDRSICDAFPVTSLSAPLAIAGGALALGLLLMAWRGGMLGLLTVLSVLPSLQLVSTLRWWSPHYVYVPAGLFLVLVADRVEKKGARGFALALASVLGLGLLAWNDGRRFRTDDTLWRAEVAREPACREGHFYLAEAARARRDLTAASAHYEAALGSRAGMLAFVDLDAALTNQGVMLFAQRRFEEAGRAFGAALGHAREPSARRKLEHDLAAVALASGDAPRALALLEAEVARPDAYRESLTLRAKALEALGRSAEAEADRARAAAK